MALWQANFVKTQLESFFPGSTFEIKIIKTTGDQLLDVALSKIGDKGLFTKQIEAALLQGEIDFAVHSLKDLQTAQPDGLVIGAVCKREVPNDVLISRSYGSIDDLPRGATVATGSLRRVCQLLAYRPELRIEDIRGNVPTRLKKYNDSELDGLILAYAGLHRLGLDENIRQLVPFDVMLPAAGQGAVGIEVRADDKEILEFVAALDDGPTRTCVTAEREFLRRLEGGCQVPIGAYATMEEGRVHLEGMVGSLDGRVCYRESLECLVDEAEDIGVRLAEMLIAKGADKLLAESREQTEASRKSVSQ